MPTPARVHIHAYVCLRDLVAEIARGHYPTKQGLAAKLERTPRTIQTYLRALVNDFGAPLAFDWRKNGWYLRDPAWRLGDPDASAGPTPQSWAPLAGRNLKHCKGIAPYV